MSSITATAKTCASTCEILNEEPMFLQEGGEEKLNMFRKELETFVKLLPAPAIMSQTFMALNPYCLCPAEVGEEEATAIEKWWSSPETRKAFRDFITTNKHKVNGKFGNWSSGFLGSRWCDCMLNGRNCRIAFYSRKHNPKFFENQPTMEGKNYALIIDATL